MISDIALISVPGYSPSANEYPLFNTSVGDVYAEYTIEDVKVSKDLDQTITISEFAGYENYNIVRIGNIYYGITSIRQNTRVKGSVDISITALGLTSAMSDNHSTVSGYFVKMPAADTEYYENNGVGKETFYNADALPQLPKYYINQIFWGEITLKAKLPEVGSESVVKKGIHRYGFFFQYPEQDVRLPTLATDVLFPSLDDILNCDNFGNLTGDDIADISVSIRCPYNYTLQGVGYPQLSENSAAFAPSGILGTFTEDQIAKTIKVYLLSDRGTSLSWREEMDVTDIIPQIGDTLTESQRFRLRDHNGNDILQIDKSLAVWAQDIDPSDPTLPQKYVIPMRYRTISDMSGIYTELEIGTKIITLPEGKIPWSSSAWDQYRAYTMNYDRELITEDIRYAKERILTDAIQTGVSGAGIGLISMNPAVALASGIGGAVGGAITSGIDAEQRARHSKNQQTLKENLAKEQPGTVYAPSYGLTYIIQNIIRQLSLYTTKFKSDPTRKYEGYNASLEVTDEGITRFANGFNRMLYASFKPYNATLPALLYERAVQDLADGRRVHKYKRLQ